jgi:hypothetical protein
MGPRRLVAAHEYFTAIAAGREFRFIGNRRNNPPVLAAVPQGCFAIALPPASSATAGATITANSREPEFRCRDREVTRPKTDMSPGLTGELTFLGGGLYNLFIAYPNFDLFRLDIRMVEEGSRSCLSVVNRRNPPIPCWGDHLGAANQAFSNEAEICYLNQT